MEAQGTGAISSAFGRYLPENFESDDPMKNCDAKASSNHDPQRPREIVKTDIQKVALESAGGSYGKKEVEKRIQALIQACEIAVQTRTKVARYKYNLGRTLYAMASITNGEIKLSSLQRASRYFEQAVELGYPAAYNDLALLYRDGEYFLQGSNEPLQPNRRKAKELFESGAKLGHILAQYNLGMAYINGGLSLDVENVNKRNAEAFDWLSRASERGFVPAMIETARAMYENRGIETSTSNKLDKQATEKKAEELLKTAASRGSWEAMYWLGHFNKRTHPERAIVWYARAAEAGDTRSQTDLAEMLTNGSGLPAPQREAAGRYWRLAAEAGSKEAQMRLANLLAKGEIPFRPQLKGNPDGGAAEVKALYSSAFARGNIEAGYNLAELYQTGFPKGKGSRAIPMSPEKAIDLYFKVIEKVKTSEAGTLQANPEFKILSAFRIMSMYTKGEAKRFDGTSVITEDQFDQLEKEYGDSSDVYYVNISTLGNINCGRTRYHNVRVLVWNWKNNNPPTDEQLDWWQLNKRCIQEQRKYERDLKLIRRKVRPKKEAHIGITSKIRRTILREFKAAQRDVKRRGPKAKAFTQRMVELVRKRARQKSRR